jgi:hypothetical protein
MDHHPAKRLTDHQRAAFLGPINPDVVTAAAVRAREVKCICTRSPWCRGASSRDWLTCSTACRACQPTPWQAPTRTPAVAGDAVQAGSGALDADQG